MNAATQQLQGTISPACVASATRPAGRNVRPILRVLPPMSIQPPRQYSIQGVTQDGRTFRPSDWAERLAGAMSSFRPGGVQGGIGAFIGYSPYCVPRVVSGVKCVIVNEALRDIEPMAWDFVMSFARDNGLNVVEVTGPLTD
jgi:hypothetical protein